jgi:hypothetical protein
MVSHMKIMIFVSVALVLAACLVGSSRAQDKTQLQQNIERALKANEPDWNCQKSTPEGEPGPESPRVFYNFQCRYKGQQLNQLSGAIYVLDSKQDAVKMLDRSQMMLQINESKPQYGIGEQAYGYEGHGSAWITFRNGTVFGQVNVGVIDPRTVANPSAEMDAYTNQALDIAKRFAFYLAQYGVGPQQLVGPLDFPDPKK